MAKRTMTPEELEWEANRDARTQWVLRRLNQTWREIEQQEAPTHSALRRRLFPWRIRVERLS